VTDGTAQRPHAADDAGPGDAVLLGIADLLTENARRADVVGRIGDARFAILMPGVVTSSEADAIAVRIRDAIAATDFATPAGAVRAACRIGVARAPRGRTAVALAELLARAERALAADTAAMRRTVAAPRPGDGDDAAGDPDDADIPPTGRPDAAVAAVAGASPRARREPPSGLSRRGSGT
jgi:hypothetical protein